MGRYLSKIILEGEDGNGLGNMQLKYLQDAKTRYIGHLPDGTIRPLANPTVDFQPIYDRIAEGENAMRTQISTIVDATISALNTNSRYALEFVNARNKDPNDVRRILTVNNLTKMGILHLDFVATRNGSISVAMLPNSSPTPDSLLESTGYNANESIYIDANTREVRGVGLTNGRRYIVDLIGFFS